MGNACCAEPKPDIQAKRSMDEEFFKLHVDAGHMNDRRCACGVREFTIRARGAAVTLSTRSRPHETSLTYPVDGICYTGYVIPYAHAVAATRRARVTTPAATSQHSGSMVC